MAATREYSVSELERALQCGGWVELSIKTLRAAVKSGAKLMLQHNGNPETGVVMLNEETVGFVPAATL